MSDRTGMNIGEGIAPPPSGEVGLRNQLRARWRKQPLAVHAGVSIAALLDPRRRVLGPRPLALLRRADDRRALLDPPAAAAPVQARRPDRARPALPLAGAIVRDPARDHLRGLLGAESSPRARHARRRGRARRALPVLLLEDVRDPGVRRLAGRRDGRLHARLRDDGRRPEHRRRLRRPCSTSGTSRSTRPAPTRPPGSRRCSSRTAPGISARSGITPDLPGIHVSIFLLLAVAGCADGALRDPDRPADPAPARRLPRDRDARLRRDPAADRAQQRQLPRHRLQPDERPERHHAARRAGLRQSDLRPLARLPARQLPDLLHPHHVRAPDHLDGRLLLDRDRAAALHGLLLVPAAVLAARACVDRDPRGRDSGRRDGRAADADEDVGVRERRVLRRHRRCVLRDLQERDVPGRLLLQHLGLHPLHGHPRRDGEHLGRDRRRCVPRVPEPGGAREHGAVAEHEHLLHRRPATAR